MQAGGEGQGGVVVAVCGEDRQGTGGGAPATLRAVEQGHQPVAAESGHEAATVVNRRYLGREAGAHHPEQPLRGPAGLRQRGKAAEIREQDAGVDRLGVAVTGGGASGEPLMQPWSQVPGGGALVIGTPQQSVDACTHDRRWARGGEDIVAAGGDGRADGGVSGIRGSDQDGGDAVRLVPAELAYQLK